MRFYSLVVTLVFLLTFISCDEIFEEDISEDSIVVYSPKDNIVINDTVVTFYWDPMDYADQYNLQVVSPSFDSMKYLAIDSIVEVNSISFSLTDGDYEWRVKAENGYYETDYFYNTFSVEAE